MNTQDTASIVAHEPATGSGTGLFAVDPGLAIWTWVVFGLLLIVLRKYAWKPMMDSVKARENTLAEAVENARRMKEELDKISIRQEAALKEAGEQAKAIIDSGRKSAEEVAAEVIQRSRAEAEKGVVMAREQIAFEKDRAVAELKNQAVDMIIKTSEKLIETNLDDELHRRDVRKWLDRL
jgi:F-type H+-transporting ATPase subunit b